MSKDVIQYAFVAGEISPKLFGRVDFEKYDFGLQTAINWFVDYRGGLTTRPGLLFSDYLQNPTSNTKYAKFQYSLDDTDTYLVIFGDGYIRFVQSGSYILEANKTITAITKATPPVVTSAAHGFSNGDWIKISGVVGMTELNDRTFEVANVTTNTFALLDVTTDASLVGADYTTYVSGGVANRIYTIVNPYDEADLDRLKVYQIRNYLRCTHPDYPVKNLTRTNDTSWAIANETIGNAGTRPGAPTITPSAAGSAGVGFVVTAVDANGVESVASPMTINAACVNYTTTAGFVTVSWTAVAGARYYNIYRTLVLSAGASVHAAMQLGYVGTTYVNLFTDNNIVPNFTKAPPQIYNPFADGAIDFITITAAGTGYTSSPTITMGGGGTGFLGTAIISGGAVVGVVIHQRGSGYVSPTISFSGGAGSGATATATATAVGGNYPSVSTLFQQRQIYAATINYPLGVYGSRVAQFGNFDVSFIQNDGDAYEFELDASTVAPIRHLVVMRGGMLLMSQAGVWQLSGGSTGIITPTNALAEPQTYLGCSDVPPLYIDTDLLYTVEKDSTVRLLSYSDYSKLYGGQDMSILSNHLFKATNKIVRWSYAETPFRLVHAVREDGTLLTFCIVKEQNVFAWTRNTTQGFFKDVLVLEEAGVDVAYVAVERVINGRTVKTIEYFASREFAHVEDAVCSDGALTLGATYPNATLDLTLGDNDYCIIETDPDVLSIDDVGSVIRAGGGKIEIIERIRPFSSAFSSAFANLSYGGFVLRPVTDVIHETEEPRLFLAGEWTLDAPVMSVSGLWHLEGATVAVLADGSVQANRVVTNGAITLDNEATRVVIGLPFVAKAQTLSPTAPDAIIEGHRKNIKGVALRLNEGRGLAIGPLESSTYEMKDRTSETYGEPTDLRTGSFYESVDGGWDEETSLWFIQRYPLPASLLGFVTDLEVGDDND